MQLLKTIRILLVEKDALKANVTVIFLFRGSEDYEHPARRMEAMPLYKYSIFDLPSSETT